tara:strand:+ start:40 stop:1227 length:1188 start_codon:yes stop_codon:yes gene_type:complete
MAFIDQVQDLTSLTVSDNDELSQFLKDGVIDVTSKCLAMNPGMMEEFSRESAEQTSNGFNPGSVKILSVLRESGTDGEWYPCRKAPIELQYRVTDTSSLHYASKFNPVYMITQNRNVHVYPAPSGAGNDGFKVLYVNYDPEETDGTDLQHDSTGIKWFPDDKVYLVIMYAGIRLLGATMGAKSIDALAITSVVPDAPDDPSFGTTAVVAQSAGTFETAPTYNKPTYSKPSTGASTSQFDTFLVDNEDPELAGTELGRIQHEQSEYQTNLNADLAQYQADIQNELNNFNKDNAIYQKGIQEVLKELDVASAKAQKDADLEAQRIITEYNSTLQKYQQQVASYQGEVQAEIQEYANYLQEVQLEYTWLQEQQAKLLNEYNQAFQYMAGPQRPQKEKS